MVSLSLYPLPLLSRSATALKSRFEALYKSEHNYWGRGKEKKQRNRGWREKQKAGKQLKGFTRLPLPIPPSAHITAWRSRVPRCKRTTHRSEDRRRVMLLRQSFALWWGEEEHFSDSTQTQLAEPEPSPGGAGDPSSPISFCSSFSAGSAAPALTANRRRPASRGVRGRSLAAPTSGLQLLDRAACGPSAEVPVAQTFSVLLLTFTLQYRLPAFDNLVHSCFAEIQFNSSSIYQDLKRLAIIFWNVKGSNLNISCYYFVTEKKKKWEQDYNSNLDFFSLLDLYSLPHSV